jgi:hypothetical protein
MYKRGVIWIIRFSADGEYDEDDEYDEEGENIEEGEKVEDNADGEENCDAEVIQKNVHERAVRRSDSTVHQSRF